jgi:hypothetical protein
MLTEEMVSFLESGCALIVGTVGEDGAPLASRGWGLDIDRGETVGHLLLAGDDMALAANLAPTTRLAVTGTHVLTLRSVQLKGSVRSTAPATDGQRARFLRYCDEFFGDVLAIDSIAPSLMERLMPIDLIACAFAIEEAFDQTPGPGAGARLSGADR